MGKTTKKTIEDTNKVHSTSYQGTLSWALSRGGPESVTYSRVEKGKNRYERMEKNK